MKLIAISVLLGLLGLSITSILELNGITASNELVLGLWITGFFSPSVYVLGKVYEEIKKKKL
jgi:hypothetical protein